MILEPKVDDSYQYFLSIFRFYYQRLYTLFLVIRIRIVTYYFSGRVIIHGGRLFIWTRSFTPSPLNASKTHVFDVGLGALSSSSLSVVLSKSYFIYYLKLTCIKKLFSNRQSYLKIEASDAFILPFLFFSIVFPLCDHQVVSLDSSDTSDIFKVSFIIGF